VPVTPVETFLQQAIGLDSASIGVEALQHLQNARLHSTGLDASDYAGFLHKSPEEQAQLIESVVVTETWFFRNHLSFDFIAEWLQQPSRRSQNLRLLSLPCATGEEAYSLVMTLLNQGFSPAQLSLDAVDISVQALRVAQQGSYRSSAFRGEPGRQAQQNFFHLVEQRTALNTEVLYQVKPAVQACIHWQQGNILDAHLFPHSALFDVIFCRNLLIYLTKKASAQAINNLMRWLKPTGLLCVGHAERSLVSQAGFVQVTRPGIFVCQHPHAAGNEAAVRTASKVPKLAVRSPLRPSPNLTAFQPNPAATAAVMPSEVEASLSAMQHLEQAQKLADQGALHVALQHCQAFLQQQPEIAEGHFLCALIYQARHDEPQAERYFQQTLYLQPNHEEALRHLMMLLQRQGRTAQATSLQQRLQRLRSLARQSP